MIDLVGLRNANRPHGQHSVVLAEDAARYMDFRSDRGGDMGSIPASSHQIYLTFPAESTFTEDDVANYFGYSYTIYHLSTCNDDLKMFFP